MPHKSTVRTYLMILTLIAVFCILKYAETLFVPLTLAVVLGVVLSPLSEAVERTGAPRALAAFATMALGIFAIVIVALLLEPYITRAIARAPLIWLELRGTIAELKSMLRGLEEISDSVAQAIDPEGAQDGASNGDAMEVPSFTDAIFYAPQYAAQVMIFIGTLYFFLLARRDVYDSVGNTFASLKASDLLYAETQVARYFLTITMINASFGILVAVMLSLIGMPSPILWGMLAFGVNYVLYLGPATLAAGLVVAGVIAFDGAYSFLPAALYLSMNATEGQFVTPALVGKSMRVNPLFVFLSLVLWLWLWGPAGGFIAIPVLIWSLIVTSRALKRMRRLGRAETARTVSGVTLPLPATAPARD